LRTIVIVAQLGVIALVVTPGRMGVGRVTNDQYSQLDRRLDFGQQPGRYQHAAHSPHQTNPDRATLGRANLVRTARIGDVTVSVPRQHRLAPNSRTVSRNTTSTGVQYRVSAPFRGPVSMRSPRRWLRLSIGSTNWHLRVLLICAGVIGGTFLVAG